MNDCGSTKAFTRFLACVAAVVTFIVISQIPCQAAENPSDELTSNIFYRLPFSEDRDRVLKSVSNAMKTGLTEARLVPVIEKSLDGGVSAEGLSRIIDIIGAASGKGLPVQPYTGKVMEGLAKKVDENRVIRALEKMDKRMEYAASLAEKGGSRSGDLVTKTADAVAAGMSKKSLEKIFTVMGKERTNRNIKPEEIMEMVKTASGYGVDSGSVRDYAVSLMRNDEADQDDIKKYLRRLSEISPDSRSEGDHDDEGMKSDSDDGDDDGDGGTDDSVGEEESHEAGESDDHESDDHESDD